MSQTRLQFCAERAADCRRYQRQSSGPADSRRWQELAEAWDRLGAGIAPPRRRAVLRQAPPHRASGAAPMTTRGMGPRSF
jgi:hypothetical protein